MNRGKNRTLELSVLPFGIYMLFYTTIFLIGFIGLAFSVFDQFLSEARAEVYQESAQQSDRLPEEQQRLADGPSVPTPIPPQQEVAQGIEATTLSGKALMENSDCFVCHKVDIQLVGPSFQDIAVRYKTDALALDQLILKVLEGGGGNWGPIPMAPHPTLPLADIKAMVTWILEQGGAADKAQPVVLPTTWIKPPVEPPVMKEIAYADPAKIPTYAPLRKTIQPPAPLPDAGPIHKAKADLGRYFFFDPRLSGDATLSCATCHNPEKGFSDGQALAQGYPGALYFRNSPTLINATLNKRFMWDGRLDGSDAATVVRDMITESHTMNMDSRLMQERLKQVPEYVAQWKEIFGEDQDPYGPQVYAVVGEFLKTLRSSNVPFDNYLRGDKKALSKKARRGLALFEGKAACIQCHNGPLFSDGELHATGVPENPEVWNTPLRAITMLRYYSTSGVPNYMNLRTDVGHYAVTKAESDVGKFRTASLRDLKHTAPYMHNGMFDTLREVIEFYNRGAGESQNKESNLKPLGLTGTEVVELVAFLESLSGDPVAVQKPQIPEYKLREFGKN